MRACHNPGDTALRTGLQNLVALALFSRVLLLPSYCSWALVRSIKGHSLHSLI